MELQGDRYVSEYKMHSVNYIVYAIVEVVLRSQLDSPQTALFPPLL